MQFAKRLLMIAGAVALSGLFAAMFVPRTVHAIVATLVQIVPGTTTHLGQNESQFVNLFCGVGRDGCLPMDSSGLLTLTNYVVPAGYTFVITDYEWDLFGASGGVQVCDTMEVIVGVSTRPLLPVQSCTVSTAAGVGHRAEHFTSGLRVASGIPIRDADANAGIGSADIQGYLVPN